MIKLVVMRIQTGYYISKTVPISELVESHAEELTSTGEVPYPCNCLSTSCTSLRNDRKLFCAGNPLIEKRLYVLSA